MKVPPYGPGRNLVGATTSAAKSCPPPLSWVKKTQNLKQQSAGGMGRWGALGIAQGVMKVTPYALFLTWAGWRRRAAPSCRTALWGVKQQQKHSNDDQLLIEGT